MRSIHNVAVARFTPSPKYILCILCKASCW